MSVKDKGWFPVVFMFAVTVFFVAILVALSALTRDRVEANKRLAFQRAVLQALRVKIHEGASGLEVDSIFKVRVKEPDSTSAGAYMFIETDTVRAYALPIAGAGFWDKIKGIIAIAPDYRTIVGISFYEQNETPGLGGEIVKQPFREQFNGKKIRKTGIPIELRPVGATLDSNSVEAVTGATQTSTRLMKFLNAQVAEWRDGIIGQKVEK